MRVGLIAFELNVIVFKTIFNIAFLLTTTSLNALYKESIIV